MAVSRAFGSIWRIFENSRTLPVDSAELEDQRQPPPASSHISSFPSHLRLKTLPEVRYCDRVKVIQGEEVIVVVVVWTCVEDFRGAGYFYGGRNEKATRARGLVRVHMKSSFFRTRCVPLGNSKRPYYLTATSAAGPLHPGSIAALSWNVKGWRPKGGRVRC